MTSTGTSTVALAVEDEAAIRELVAQADRAQSDAAVLPGLHLEQMAIVNIAGRRLLGREAFAEAMSAALASSLKDVQTSVEIVDIRVVATDVALVSCIKTVHDNRQDSEGALPLAGALTYVVVRTADGWRIGLAQTTPIQ
ncbi:uncharacterized protein (TIGR02246 family) [Kribbella orskensis]|uniref:Uncharacterized protein (TIGR02246 family) n=1 Tax=Kribbella orskensis TaxID=2512216 RepID=A0ABY2BGW3_9ACTN|nr:MULTISPECIES: SgcJ/EcaC family oxidoreductase [Kribbella]TCN38407.1 uncharacterized protein (TIGR02246 family) [Kribbella sp. VKM Ac-2500]TCO20063.1 uncharacterized protein (TIGR02246 family) [Kribbella orskensis]